MRGRASLALVLSADATLFSYLVIMLLHSTFEHYDIALLALHATHIFTAILGYVIVHYSKSSLDLLKLLTLFYLVAFVVDSLTVFARIVLSPSSTVSALRIALGVGYVLLDLVGAFFADMTRSTAYLLAVRSDEHMQAIALEEHRRVSAMPPSTTASLPSGELRDASANV